MGPKWTVEVFFSFCGYFYIVSLFMVKHYYVSSIIVFVLCIWPIVHCIIRSCYPENRANQLNDIREDLIELNSKVDNMTDELNNRLDFLEAKIDEVLNLVREPE